MATDPDRGRSDAGLASWCLVRRVCCGQPGFDDAVRSFVCDHAGAAAELAREDAQVFVLTDPAGDRVSEPMAVALVLPVPEAGAVIRLAADSHGEVLGRLLAPVTDALRAQGMLRVVCGSAGFACDAVAALEHLGFRRHGDGFLLDL